MDNRLDAIAKTLATRPECQLGPPLTEGEVAGYESRNSVTLPEDYRAFATRLGNGGCGPGLHRFFPLATARVDRTLLRPFPFLPDQLLGWDWDSEKGAWEFDGSPFSPELWSGAITLTDEGCTFNQLLAVNGPARGRAVFIDVDRNNWPTFHPAPDFLTWYEDWLFDRRYRLLPNDDVALAEFMLSADIGSEDAVRAAYRLAAPFPGTSTDAVRTLGEAVCEEGTGTAARYRAVWTLGEMAARALGSGFQAVVVVSHAREYVRRALADVDPAIRALAIRYVADTDVVRPFLDDPDPRCVGSALVTLAQTDEHHPEPLRRLLADGAPDVRVIAAESGRCAYRESDWRWESGVVALSDVLAEMFRTVVDDPEPRVRAASIVILASHRPVEHHDTFLAAAHDPDEEVRFRAVQALRLAGDRPEGRQRLAAVADTDPSAAIRAEALDQLCGSHAS